MNLNFKSFLRTLPLLLLIGACSSGYDDDTSSYQGETGANSASAPATPSTSSSTTSGSGTATSGSSTTDTTATDSSTLEPPVWSGELVTFTKTDGSDPNDESNQDRLTSNVWITRGNGGGQIYNAAVNSSANKELSPVGTEWAVGLLEDRATLTFENFRSAVTKPQEVVDTNLVVHLIEDDIYLSVVFTSWSVGQKGGFQYQRSTP